MFNIFKKNSSRKNEDLETYPTSLEKLTEMFEDIGSKRDWSMKENMLWVYLFFDRKVEKLNDIATKLQKKGFVIDSIEITDDKEKYRLTIHEIGIHTPNSLYDQCQKLFKYARKNSIETFDGWDVRPPFVIPPSGYEVFYTQKYNEAVKKVLDENWERVQEHKITANEGMDNAFNELKQRIASGTLHPFA